MIYPKFPQRYLAAVVVCLILTLGSLGALFLIYLFNEGRSPLIAHNSGAAIGSGVVSIKPALTVQQQQLQQQLQQTPSPQKKRIYLPQSLGLLNANEDDDDDDDPMVEIVDGSDDGDSLADSESDVSARSQSPHANDSNDFEDDMLNIDDDVGVGGSERQQSQQQEQQHFVNDNYQLQQMLGAVVDNKDQLLQQPAQPIADEMPLRMLNVPRATEEADIDSKELTIDDDEGDDLSDDYDISISAEMWQQQNRRQKQNQLDALQREKPDKDSNYDTIYIDDFERPPANPSSLKASTRGIFQRFQEPRSDEFINMEITDINYSEPIIGGDNDHNGAAQVATVKATRAPKTLQLRQQRRNRQSHKNRQPQEQQQKEQEPRLPLRKRYRQKAVARRVLPAYYFNKLHNGHKQYNTNSRQPVSVDDEGGDDEDADADDEEVYLLGSGSGAGSFSVDNFAFRDIDSEGEEADEIENDIDAAETAEFIKRIHYKMQQTAKANGRHDNSFSNNVSNGKNCNNNINNNNSRRKEYKQKVSKMRDGCQTQRKKGRKESPQEINVRSKPQQSKIQHVNKKISAAELAEFNDALMAYRSNSSGANAKSSNANRESNRSSAAIEAIDFYNLSSELVSNLSAPQLYQDEKFVSSMHVAAAAQAATAAVAAATPTTITATATVVGTSSDRAAEVLLLRTTATTARATDAAAMKAAAATSTTSNHNNRLKIAEQQKQQQQQQQPVAINIAAAELPTGASSADDGNRRAVLSVSSISGGGGTPTNSAAWLETRTRRIIGNVKKSEERSRQLLLCEEAGGGELCRMLFKGHLNE